MQKKFALSGVKISFIKNLIERKYWNAKAGKYEITEDEKKGTFNFMVIFNKDNTDEMFKYKEYKQMEQNLYYEAFGVKEYGGKCSSIVDGDKKRKTDANGNEIVDPRYEGQFIININNRNKIIVVDSSKNRIEDPEDPVFDDFHWNVDIVFRLEARKSKDTNRIFAIVTVVKLNKAIEYQYVDQDNSDDIDLLNFDEGETKPKATINSDQNDSYNPLDYF